MDKEKTEYTITFIYFMEVVILSSKDPVSMLMDVVCLDNTLIRSADTVVITNDGSSLFDTLLVEVTLQYFIGPLAMHYALPKEYSSCI